MRKAGVALLCGAAGLLLAGRAPAEDPPGAADSTRRAFETLVKRVTDDLPSTGPSLTRCVRELVAAGDAQVLAVLAEYWRPERLRDRRQWTTLDQMRAMIRLLYGDAKPAGERGWGFVVRHGAVLHLVPDSSSGGGWDPRFPPLEELIGERSLVAPPAPDARLLLQDIREGTPDDLSRVAKEGLYSALGEAAAGAPELVSELVALYRNAPDAPFLALALGHANTPDCRKALLAGVLAAARRLASGGMDPGEECMFRWRMGTVAESLYAVAPDAAREAAALAAGDARMSRLELLGPVVSVPLLLDELEAAKPGEERLAAWSELREVLLSRGFGPRLEAGRVPRLVKDLLALADELPPEERGRLWTAAESYFLADNRYPIRWSSTINGRSEWVVGRSLGPYPDMETMLRRMREDFEAGRLAFLDRGDGPGALAPRPRRLASAGQRGHSDFPPPSGLSAPSPDFPVFLKAEWNDGDLVISLKNIGHEPLLVSPLISRYARAEVTEVTTRENGVTSTHRELKLDLGFLKARLVVPREALVRVDPDAAWSWRQSIRAEDRDVDQVVIEFSLFHAIPGGTDLPWLDVLHETRVR